MQKLTNLLEKWYKFRNPPFKYFARQAEERNKLNGNKPRYYEVNMGKGKSNFVEVKNKRINT